MTNNKLFLVVVVLIGLIVFAGLSYNPQSNNPAEKVTTRIGDDVLIRSHSPTKGPASAPVTIVEFLDPECESCSAMHPIVTTLLAEYPEKVRLVTRYMPLHGNSLFAASALEEARELGKYDEALETLFKKQPEWASHHAPRPELIVVYLKAMGIPEKRLEKTYLIEKHREKIELDRADGVKAGVHMTPTFFVNGMMLGEIGYRPLKNAIEQAQAAKQNPN